MVEQAGRASKQAEADAATRQETGSATEPAPLAGSLLALQRRAGNAAVAGMVGAGGSASGPLRRTGSSTPTVQRLTEAQRLRITRVISWIIPGAQVLKMLGFSITGVAVGLRGSANEGAGVGAGAGVDGMVFVDPVRWEATGDVIPYAEVGASVSAGATGGVVVGIRLTPDSAGAVGRAHEGYSGGSLNANLQAVLGAGAFLSTGILSGGEGWAGIVITLGPEAGADASYSYGVSSTSTAETIGTSVRDTIQGIVERGTQLAAAVRGLSQGIASLVAQVFAILDSSQWDLSAYTPGEQASWREFGAGLRNVITGDRAGAPTAPGAAAPSPLDRFMAEEQRGMTVSSRLRIGQEGGVMSIIGVVEAVNRLDTDRRRRAGQPPRSPRLLEPSYFTSHTYTQFLGLMGGNGMLATR